MRRALSRDAVCIVCLRRYIREGWTAQLVLKSRQDQEHKEGVTEGVDEIRSRHLGGWHVNKRRGERRLSRRLSKEVQLRQGERETVC